MRVLACGAAVATALLAPAPYDAAAAPVAAARAACGVPVFDGDVHGDDSGHVRIATARGTCADDLAVRCEDGVVVVAHQAGGADPVVLHPTDGDVACADVRAVRVRVFGGADRVAMPGLDAATGIGRSGGDWSVDVDLGRGEDRFRGSAKAEGVDAGPGNDRVLTAGGEDLLLGGPGRDYLFGERGHDFLIGGAGRDRLRGGAGTDCVHPGDRGECGYGGIEPS